MNFYISLLLIIIRQVFLTPFCDIWKSGWLFTVCYCVEHGFKVVLLLTSLSCHFWYYVKRDGFKTMWLDKQKNWLFWYIFRHDKLIRVALAFWYYVNHNGSKTLPVFLLTITIFWYHAKHDGSKTYLANKYQRVSFCYHVNHDGFKTSQDVYMKIIVFHKIF